MGFSAQWLALREPADLAARDAALLRAAAEAAGPAPVILDMGCGTGATYRALSPHLPADTRWRLLDNDPHLLRIATAQIGNVAEPVLGDLSDVAALPLAGVSLVTASALLDLVSAAWIEAFATRLRVPFYAALNYDGQMYWTPDDPNDHTITTAFNRDQRKDKGFGPALGPDSGQRAEAILQAAGFEVQHAASPWVLGPDQADLQRALTDGIAAAAAEAGAPSAPDWAATRRHTAQHGQCRIGHVDLLALPRAGGGDAD